MDMPIVFAALASAALLLIEHWAPWALYLRRPLDRSEAYVMGTAALIVPEIVALLSTPGWDGARAARLILVVTLTGGLAVLAARWIDSYAVTRAELRAERDAHHEPAQE